MSKHPTAANQHSLRSTRPKQVVEQLPELPTPDSLLNRLSFHCWTECNLPVGAGLESWQNAAWRVFQDLHTHIKKMAV